MNLQLSRRTFLKQGAVIGALGVLSPTILASRANGNSPQEAGTDESTSTDRSPWTTLQGSVVEFGDGFITAESKGDTYRVPIFGFPTAWIPLAGDMVALTNFPGDGLVAMPVAVKVSGKVNGRGRRLQIGQSTFDVVDATVGQEPPEVSSASITANRHGLDRAFRVN